MDNRVTGQLLDKVRNHDSAAFQELVNRTHRYAYGLLFRITGNAEDSRDLVQDVYIRVWKNIGTMEPGRSFDPWFSTLVRNLAIDWLRSQKPRQNRGIPLAGIEVSDRSSAGPDRILERKEFRQLITDWLPNLPEKQLRIFMMRDMENLSIKEVQAETGLSEQTIKTNLWLARKKLREYLERIGYR